MTATQGSQRTEQRQVFRMEGDGVVAYTVPVAPPVYFKVREYQNATAWGYARIGVIEAVFTEEASAQRWAHLRAFYTGRRTDVHQIANRAWRPAIYPGFTKLST